MSPYGKLICDVTGCMPEDTHDIEEMMRSQHATLDHLSRKQFTKLARAAHRGLAAYRAAIGGAS